MQKQSELTIITKSKDLCSYVMTITQKSPKQYRYTFTSRLQNLSLDIIEKLYRANDTFVTKGKGNVSDSTIRFVHKSMYEYFVAEYIFSKIKNYMETGLDRTLHVELVLLLRDRTISSEIGEYLEQKLKDDSDMDFGKFEIFTERMLVLGIHYYPENKDDTNLCRDPSIDNLAELRKKKSAQEKSVFENLVAILQLFRSAKGLKNRENLLFANRPYARKVLPAYLRKGHYNGPGMEPFDLSGFDLSQMDASHLDLSRSVLQDCNLCNTDFSYTNLASADLSGSILNGAVFDHANLYGIDAESVDLIRKNNSCSWANFTGLQKIKDYNTKLIPGSLYEFGSYKQDADGTEKPIVWRVLDVDIEQGKVLLLSDKILDAMPYWKAFETTNWEKCGQDDRGIRFWLNHEFYQEAFRDSADASRIMETTVMPDENPNPNYKEINQGRATRDKIFLLSGQEVIQYFSGDDSLGGVDRDALMARGSDYAQKNTELLVGANGNSVWWLRSVGVSGSGAMSVHGDGDVATGGSHVYSDDVGVRPALYLRIENLKS